MLNSQLETPKPDGVSMVADFVDGLKLRLKLDRGSSDCVAGEESSKGPSHSEPARDEKPASPVSKSWHFTATPRIIGGPGRSII